MKKIYFLCLFLYFAIGYAQDYGISTPVFVNCENKPYIQARDCFDQQIQQLIFDNFQVADYILKNNYGAINLITYI
jgi:hypothetical protein